MRPESAMPDSSLRYIEFLSHAMSFSESAQPLDAVHHLWILVQIKLHLDFTSRGLARQ